MQTTQIKKKNIQSVSRITKSKITLQQKLGISLVSTNLPKCKQNIYQKMSLKPNIRKQKNKQRLQLRSLSAQRNKRKKQKQIKKSQYNTNGTQYIKIKQQLRDCIQENINKLELAYDQLKLKRSLITQRQSEKSNNKPRFSDLQKIEELKGNFYNNQKIFLNKCVPKSKINLNQFTKNTAVIKEKQSLNLNYLQNNTELKNSNSYVSKNSPSVYIKQRQKSAKSINSYSIFQGSYISQTVMNSSLNNLQVIPIGLNVSLSQKNKLFQIITKNQDKNNDRSLTKTIKNPKKGIMVTSSNKKQNNISLSSSVISLEAGKVLNREIDEKKENYRFSTNRINLFGTITIDEQKQNQRGKVK